jgi:hypothetical protein
MREIERFTAKSGAGTFVTQIVIYEVAEVISSNTCCVAQPVSIREARTPSGFQCTSIDDDTWRIDDLGVTVHRVR